VLATSLDHEEAITTRAKRAAYVLNESAVPGHVTTDQRGRRLHGAIAMESLRRAVGRRPTVPAPIERCRDPRAGSMGYGRTRTYRWRLC
jgi:hypothetical protein